MCRPVFLSFAVLALLATPLFAQRPDFSNLLRRFDQNKNGTLEKSELPRQLQGRFAGLDRNKDGKVDSKEFAAVRPNRSNRSSNNGEINTPPARGERHQDSLKVGDVAPDFSLKQAEGDKVVTLSSFQGKKPVVLIFGSYT